ncbi:MAG TPA: lmo0937 family membrane protein [Gemmatimonadales bacterium]|nr:lmo0937 family membrane protein [Gemmatimonadales bacterium]
MDGADAQVPIYQFKNGETTMLWLAILLLVAWVLGFAVFKIAGGLIHLLLILAVVVFVYQLVTGRRAI